VGDAPYIALIAAVSLIALNAFFAAVEIAYVSARRSRLQELADRQDRRARLALALLDDLSGLLAAVQIAVTLIGVLAGATVVTAVGTSLGHLLHSLGWSSVSAYGLGLAIGTVAFSLLVILLGELAPKRIAYQRAEGIALAVAPVMRGLIWFIYPVIWLLARCTNGISRLLGVRTTDTRRYTQAELALVVDLTEDLTRDERELTRRVLAFTETEVRETMVPRTDWVAVGAEATLNEFIEVALRSGFSRLPIHGANVDEVVGVFHVKEASRLARDGHGNEPIARHVKPALAVPESVSGLNALTQMREARQQMAIVIDEFGQVVGLVTVEDLLEELVGEVFDESDRQPRKWRRADDGSYLVDAGIGLKELSGVLGVRLPLSEDYETLGGLILERLGRIPAEGEQLEINGVSLRVLRVERQRIRKVRIEKSV